MAIKMASFESVFIVCCLFACCPGSRWGNTEQVVFNAGIQLLPE
jgi:hypothetical protein